MYTGNEVVRVMSDHSLIDSESYEHRYYASHPLPAGFYVVVWPSDVSCTRYDETARFVGPYPRKHDAEEAVENNLAQTLDWLDEAVQRVGSGIAVTAETR
jgi:hypothetical protein